MENSLDAAEAIHVLPVVKVKVKEYSEENHNTRHGIKKKISSGKSMSSSLIDIEENEEFPASQNVEFSQASFADTDMLSQQSSAQVKKQRKSTSNEVKELMYYEISVEDNGT